MKTCLKLCTLFVALSLPALASSVDLANSGGLLTGTNAGLTLTGSTLISAISSNLTLTGDLGTVSFSTGALDSGSLAMGGTFAPGGGFLIIGNGTSPLPNGTIFSGTFTSVTWTLVTLANGTHNYTLTGALNGTWFTGVTAVGATVQLTINTGKGFFDGSTTISSGDTNLNGPGVTLRGTVPEPASLLYLGGGLLGIAGIARRKLRL